MSGGCVLHVGMHKTGTTSLQKSLNGFSGARLAYFPDPRRRANHGPALFSLLRSLGDDRPALHRASRPPKQSRRGERERDAVVRSLDAALSELGGRRVLLSAEGAMFLGAAELRELAAFLRQRARDVEIVAYVRAPAAYMTSFVQQRIKGGSIRGFDLERELCDYRQSFTKFDEVFGRQNVRLWKFDPAAFKEGCVVRDFCSRLDIDLPAERIVRANESLSREAIGLLFIYRRLGPAHGLEPSGRRENAGIVRQLMQVGSTKFRFSPRLVRPVLDGRREDIAWMEERLGESLQERLDDERPGDVASEDDLLQPDGQAVAALLQLLGERAPAGNRGRTPEEIAALVHALRLASAPRAARAEQAVQQHGDIDMKVAELIEHIRQSNPKLLQGIPEDKAEALVRRVFKHMNDTLAKTEEGVVNYAGLGRFRLRKVEKEVDGRKVSRTKIGFRPANAKGEGKESHAAGE